MHEKMKKDLEVAPDQDFAWARAEDQEKWRTMAQQEAVIFVKLFSDQTLEELLVTRDALLEIKQYAKGAAVAISTGIAQGLQKQSESAG